MGIYVVSEFTELPDLLKRAIGSITPDDKKT
jgi:hypothetical protein